MILHRLLTVRDTKNLTFSADYRADFPPIVRAESANCPAESADCPRGLPRTTARTIGEFRTDNWRIPRGQLADSARNN